MAGATHSSAIGPQVREAAVSRDSETERICHAQSGAESSASRKGSGAATRDGAQQRNDWCDEASEAVRPQHLVRDAQAVAEVQAQDQLLEEPAGVRLCQARRPIRARVRLQVLLQESVPQ